MKTRIESLDLFVNEANKTIDELIDVLRKNNDDDKNLKQIWSWIKQNRINYSEFKELITWYYEFND